MAALLALIPLLLLRLLLSGPALAPSVPLTDGAAPAVAADDAIPHAAHLTGIDAAITMASPGTRTGTDAPGDVPPAEPGPALCVAVPPVPDAEPPRDASPPRTTSACSSAAARAPPRHART